MLHSNHPLPSAFPQSSVFSSIRSESDDDREYAELDAENYARLGPAHRAIPERALALLVTVVIETPVCLMISGGSASLLTLLRDPKRYALLLGFLPLISAVSGNVGLQASTLTTRAISHRHVDIHNYCSWLRKELLAAALLAVVIGLCVGLMALAADMLVCSGQLPLVAHVVFAATVFLSQAVSIAVAGLTGVCSPLIFTFFFHRDSGKWAGPLETAIQDIAGTALLIGLTQGILMLATRLGLHVA